MKVLKMLFFLFLVLTVSTIYAQNFKVGVTGGINFSSGSIEPDGADVVEKEYPRVSAVAEYNLGKNFWISSSFGYIGSGYTFTDFSECYVTMNYFQIDLALKYQYGTFYGFAGPIFGFFMNGEKNLVSSLEYNVDTEQYYYTYKKEDITKDFVKSTNFGMHLGIGLDIPLKKKIAILLQADYAFGLSDVIKEDVTSLKLSGLSFQTGIKFAF